MLKIYFKNRSNELEFLLQQELVPGRTYYTNFSIKGRTRKVRSGSMKGFYKIVNLPV